MSQSISFKQTTFIILSLALVQFALQMNLLRGGVEYIATSLAIDDTYYYLQTAWNTKHLGFVTFDGLHPTNGVQFLWFVIILILAIVVKTKTALLFVTLAVTFLLNCLCYLIILRIGVLLKQPLLALFVACLWSLQSLPFRIYSMGMENSLHALIFWCVVWQSLIFLLRIQHKDKPNLGSLTAVLILNAWTRLDSALLSAIVYIFCIGALGYSYRNNFKLLFQEHAKTIIGTACLAGLGLIIQLMAFQLMGGSILPVSALVKTSGASRGVSPESLDKLLEVVTLGMPSILQGRLPTLALLGLGFLGILFLLRVQILRRNHDEELQTFLSLWSCLLVGELLYHIYIAISGVQYTLYFIWYRSPSFIFWIITTSLVVFFAFEYMSWFNHSNSLPWAYLGFSLLIFCVAIYMFVRSINFSSKLYVARHEAALWIAENYPPDTIFAAWNTGQLSFFSNRTFINLDGVINNVDYYERVLSGTIPLTDYLSENRVEYLVDYDVYDSIPAFPTVNTFPLNDGTGRAIQIWQVSSQFSSTP